uniref:Uncharacterized protein n=1 Tax=Setaria viridis TaxID=4556 RepID=A0A4U6UH93_SETVI|nr:hypothetical protein SEVIR_5G187800v2 [Setaria viridis]
MNGASGPLNAGEALKSLPASLNMRLCPYGSGLSGSSGTSMSPSSILNASPMVGRSATITCAHKILTSTNFSMTPLRGLPKSATRAHLAVMQHLLDGDHGPIRQHAAVDGPEPAAADEVALREAIGGLGELCEVASVEDLVQSLL